MINRGDIKLAIDMVVNAQDDNLFGGEAEYVINTLEDCGNEISKLREQVAAQAAVIETLREALIAGWLLQCDFDDARQLADEALALSTDSTQILDEVRRAEREKVIDKCVKLGAIERDGVFAAVIRAME